MVPPTMMAMATSMMIVASTWTCAGSATRAESNTRRGNVIVGPATKGGIGEGVATVLSIFFSLNILLGLFNLIPFPPLDGYGVLGLFVPEATAVRLQVLRMQMGMFSFLGLVIAWRVFDRYFPTLFAFALHVFYSGYRFS